MPSDAAHGAARAAAGATQQWAAGVLPLALRGGRPVVLLGRDALAKGGRWSDFAGGREPQDETPRDTALRELREETGGAVAVDAALLDAALALVDVTPSGKVLYRYAVRVKYDAGLPGSFRWSHNDEKLELAWFDLDRLPPMRRVFADQMRRDAPRLRAFVEKT